MDMSFVAGVGNANCDIFFLDIPRLPREGEEVYASGFDVKAGGGLPATMTTLARLGVPVDVKTFLGGDLFSQIVEKELKASGVNYENLYHGDGMPTVVSAAMVVDGERSFVSYQEALDITARMSDHIVACLAKAKIVELHGDMLGGMLDIYHRVRNENPGVIFVMDTGWRDDLCLANYREHLALADYYTPNRREALALTGTGEPAEALKVLDRFFKHPIVKLDTEGCLVMKDGEILLVPPLPGVRQVDATGAGDAFIAGLIYGLYHNYDIVDSVLFGNIAGGLCVQAVGCLTACVAEPQLLELAKSLRDGVTGLG